MIYPAFLSTSSLTNETRRTISRLQTDLVKAQTELQTGRHADVGTTLGARTGITVELRQDRLQLQSIRESNSLVDLRLTTTQTSLEGVSNLAQSFLAALVRARSTSLSDTTVVQEATAGMKAFDEAMNSSVNGQFVFAGINSDVQPFDPYFAAVTPASRAAVASAFQTEFGFSQTSANVANLTSTQIQNFLNSDLMPMFHDPNWQTNWSSASSASVKARISRTEIADVSAHANEQAFRDLKAAYVMISDLGYENMTEQARGAILDKATELVTKAIGATSEIQSNLGVVQERVSKSSEAMDLQINLLSKSIDELEGVDPDEVATRLSTLMTQLESAYAVTKRINDLSLIDFL